MASSPAHEAVDRHIRGNGSAIVGEFADLLAIPNVTGSVADLQRNADEIVARFESRGATMEVVQLDGASPVVIGELRCDNPTATIGVYVHYDGQPVHPENWTFPPFAPTILDGDSEVDVSNDVDSEWRIYARGASDDKAPLAAITAALDAIAELERTVDLVFLFEGEEESGSPNLARYMEELAGRLEADAWLLCDGPVHQSGTPQVVFGCRGFAGFDLTFYGPERELHSGHYGNWVPNPAFELAHFLASCKDETGRVVIEGFYDDTWPISSADIKAIEALPAVEDLLEGSLGFSGSDDAYPSYAESLMYPSFNVRGIRASEVGSGARNAIPSEASASVDIRLAAGDVPDRMLDRVERHLEQAGYVVLDREPTAAERRRSRRLVTMKRDVGGYRAGRIPLDSPLALAMVEVAREASGEDVIALPTFGGSIPLYLFEDLLGAPVAMLPIANHDNNQHAPDENLRIGNLWYGIKLWATMLTSDLSAVRS